MMTFTRRQILWNAANYLGLGIAASCALSPGTAGEFTADGETIARWMDQLSSGKRSADYGDAFFRRFADPIYYIIKSFDWVPNQSQQQFSSVTVPLGYVTGFGSLPRNFWSVLRPDPAYTFPAIIHDYLYWVQNGTRDVADNIFRASMEDVGIREETRDVLYTAVRMFGQNAWEENARLKSLGEKRILRQLPPGPTVTWAEWKKRPGVFG
jgi:hypothetical protein